MRMETGRQEMSARGLILLPGGYELVELLSEPTYKGQPRLSVTEEQTRRNSRDKKQRTRREHYVELFMLP